jgi:hypothetical protein
MDTRGTLPARKGLLHTRSSFVAVLFMQHASDIAPIAAKALLISCCCLVDALQLSHEYRKAEPGMFNLLFGGERFWQAAAVREAVSCTDMELLVECTALLLPFSKSWCCNTPTQSRTSCKSTLPNTHAAAVCCCGFLQPTVSLWACQCASSTEPACSPATSHT